MLVPFIYDSAQNGSIEVPAGFITDFASTPRVPLAYWLTGGTAVAPAIIHDWLYQTHHVTRRRADAIFYEAMRSEQMPRWRSGVMWLAVRLGGWWAYRSGPQRRQILRNGL